MTNEELKTLIGEEGAKQLIETSAPQIYSTSLKERHAISVTNEHLPQVFNVIFTAVGNCLNVVKDKATPVVFSFTDLTGDVLLQARVEWIADGEDNGNWNYAVAFDKIQEKGDKVLEFTDTSTHIYFSQAWTDLYRIYIKRTEWFNIIIINAIKVLKQWLLDNTKEGSKTVVYVNEIFAAYSQVGGDGAVETAIELFGEYKALIKNDDNDASSAE